MKFILYKTLIKLTFFAKFDGEPLPFWCSKEHTYVWKNINFWDCEYGNEAEFSHELPRHAWNSQQASRRKLFAPGVGIPDKFERFSEAG